MMTELMRAIRLRRYSNRDSRVGPEKVVRLDGVQAEDLVGEGT